MATIYDKRRPRIPADLGRRIDEARGQLYFDAFVRQAVEAALGRPDEGPKAQPPRGSGSPGTTAPAPPRASVCKTHGQPIRRVGGRCNLVGCMG
jgi:hypothetical protein